MGQTAGDPQEAIQKRLEALENSIGICSVYITNLMAKNAELEAENLEADKKISELQKPKDENENPDDDSRFGIHSIVLWKLTEGHPYGTTTYFMWVCILPFVSWAVLLTQLVVLAIFAEQLNWPYCRSADDCADREQVCSILIEDEPFYGEDIGFCVDPKDDVEDHCAFMRNALKPQSSTLAVIIVYMFILAGVLREINQTIEATQAAVYRVRALNGRRYPERFHVWCVYLVQAYSIPFYIFYSSALVFYIDVDFRPSTIFLNGMAVEIVCRKWSLRCYLSAVFMPSVTLTKATQFRLQILMTTCLIS
jgi:hypothetical protein